MQDTTNTYIKISPEAKAIHIEWQAEIFTNQRQDGKLSCYIPGFEVYYTASNNDMLHLKAQKLTQFFFDHYLLDRKNKIIGLKRLMLDLNKKGFRDKKHHTDIMHRSVNSMPFNATMFSGLDKMPAGYQTATSITQVLEAELA